MSLYFLNRNCFYFFDIRLQIVFEFLGAVREKVPVPGAVIFCLNRPGKSAN